MLSSHKNSELDDENHSRSPAQRRVTHIEEEQKRHSDRSYNLVQNMNDHRGNPHNDGTTLIFPSIINFMNHKQCKTAFRVAFTINDFFTNKNEGKLFTILLYLS